MLRFTMGYPQATLCYIVKDGRVLLIHKKRGIGAGRINGPGGKVNVGEDPLAAAIRETEEEVCVIPVDPQQRGELWFHFGAENISQCLIYLASDYLGIPQETAEAIPEWFDTEALPFEQMWEDDKYWLPILLAGQRFNGTVNVVDNRASAPILNISNYIK